MTPSANVTAPVTPTKTMPAPEPSPPKPQESKKEGPESKKSTGGSVIIDPKEVINLLEYSSVPIQWIFITYLTKGTES